MKYYTVIVVKIDAFESQIINERHFSEIMKMQKNFQGMYRRVQLV